MMTLKKMFFKKRNRKIAIVAFKNITQAVFSSILYRNLKESNYNVFLIVSKNNYPYFFEEIYLQNIYYIENQIIEIQHNFLAEQFDHVLDLVNTFETKAFFSSLEIRNVITSNMITKRPFWKFIKNNIKSTNIIDNILNKLSVNNDHKGLIFNNKNQENLKLIELFDPFIYSMMYHGGFLVFFIETIEFSTQEIIKLCNKIETPILLLNSINNKPTTQFIAKECGPTVIDASVFYEPKYFQSLLNQSKAVLSFRNDIISIMSGIDKPLFIISNSLDKIENIYIESYRKHLPKVLNYNNIETDFFKS